jgi:hypothetical protein
MEGPQPSLRCIRVTTSVDDQSWPEQFLTTEDTKNLSGEGHFVKTEMRSVTQTHIPTPIPLDQCPDEAMNRNYSKGLFVFPISDDAQTDRSRDSRVALNFNSLILEQPWQAQNRFVHRSFSFD